MKCNGRLLISVLLLLLLAGTCLTCNVQAYRSMRNIESKDTQVEGEVEAPLRSNMIVIVSGFLLVETLLVILLVIAIRKHHEGKNRDD